MLRSVVFWISRAYFWGINAVYNLIYLFIPKQSVSTVKDSLLLQPAVVLADKVRKGQVKSEDIVNACIDRISEVDVVLNDVVRQKFADALDKAREKDQLVAAGKAPSAAQAPFFGVPFTLKDCIFVKGEVCTAGIPCRRECKSVRNAACVQLILDAGAIVLAITNVSEVCMWWESVNTLYGRSRNPYDTRCIVGGSSGGEGSLISSGGSIFGIGSDIGGSIRMPCFFNGIFGHKPGDSLCSDDGTYPPTYAYHKQMHSIGPMCRYAKDLYPMLTILAGPNAKKLKRPEQVDWSKVRFYYMREIKSWEVESLHSDMSSALDKVIDFVEGNYNGGCSKVDLPSVHRALVMWLNDMELGESPAFTRLMMDMQDDVNPLYEMAKFVCCQSSHTIAAIILGLFEKLNKKRKTPEQVEKLVLKRLKLQQDLTDILGDNGILLCPSHPVVAEFHTQPLLKPMNFVYTALFNSLCLPVTQVPLGLNASGLPVGIQLVTSLNNDHLSIAFANVLEQKFGGWVNF